MSREAYEQLTARIKLYNLAKEGLQDIQDGNTRPFSDAMGDIGKMRKQLPHHT